MRKSFKKIVACALAAALSIAVPVSTEGIGTVHAASQYASLPLNNSQIQGHAESRTANFYSFSIPSAGWLTFTYQGWNIGDSYYEIKNAQETTTYVKRNVWTSSDTNPLTNTVTLALEAGNYIVKVYGAGDRSGDYRMWGSFRAAENNETEPNNYFSNGMMLQQNQLVTGFMSEDDRLDFYQINVPTAMTVRVTYVSRISDSYCSVWDGNFLQKDKTEAWYASEDKPITKTLDVLLESGINYIKIEPTGNNTGRYQLKWEAAPTLITNISLTGADAVEAGSQVQLTANIMPTLATNKTLKWTSSDNSIATVSESGVVTGVREGTVTIKAEATDESGCYGTIDLKVTQNQNKQAEEVQSHAVQEVSSVKTTAKGGKKVVVTWKQQSGANKYEVQIAKDKKFTKNVVKKTFAKNKKKAKIKYKKTGKAYVRVRAIDNSGNVGNWSKVKKVKIK